jgi:16S rRNA (guanine527-N7)-methyltransferase
VTLNTPADLCQAAARVGLSLPEGKAAALLGYAALLERWNQRINLTASRTVAEILERQVLDCLMADLLPWPKPSGSEPLQVVDIGSGAGLPGLVIALRHPEFQVTTLERTGKKVSFQQEAVRTLGMTNIRVSQEDALSHARGPGGARYDVALARAFADLADTLPLAGELLRRPEPGGSAGGVLRTFKGRKLAEEIAAVLSEVRGRFAEEILQRPYEIPGTAVAGVIVQFQRI